MRMINNHKYSRKGKASKAAPKGKPMKGFRLKEVDAYLRFILFLALIGMLYIWNSHYAVKQVRKMEVLEREANSLKDKYLMKRTTLSSEIRLAQVKEKADSLGLRHATSPVYQLLANNPEEEIIPLPRIPVPDSSKVDSLQQDSIKIEDQIALQGNE